MASSPASSSNLLNTLRAALQDFKRSDARFRIVRTVTRSSVKHEASQVAPPHTTPSKIFILDSSFNPPTKAHLRIASSALLADQSEPKRLLLLLATQNADKAPKPAAFEQRLAMMGLMAEDLLEELHASRNSGSSVAQARLDEDIAVDIAVTKLPYFVDKARAVAHASWYNFTVERRADSKYKHPIPQVHLVGFDTLIRILDPKYYPEEKTLEPLQGLFEHHYLRVTMRPDDGWGGREEQLKYLEALRNGEREGEGGKREWAGRIQMVEGGKAEEQGGKGEGAGSVGVSSTKLRRAASKGEHEDVRELCSRRVADWIVDNSLYEGEDH
jgi:nicotinamide-nucleotide adenylyltransferase